MTYAEYISYHKQGDAGVEERMIASLCRYLGLNSWDAFRLIYFYTMTYHIPSALAMLLEGERNIKRLQFRTDRRYVRCNGAFPRLLTELTADKAARLQGCKAARVPQKPTMRYGVGFSSAGMQPICFSKSIAMYSHHNGLTTLFPIGKQTRTTRKARFRLFRATKSPTLINSSIKREKTRATMFLLSKQACAQLRSSARVLVGTATILNEC